MKLQQTTLVTNSKRKEKVQKFLNTYLIFKTYSKGQDLFKENFEMSSGVFSPRRSF